MPKNLGGGNVAQGLNIVRANGSADAAGALMEVRISMPTNAQFGLACRVKKVVFTSRAPLLTTVQDSQAVATMQMSVLTRQGLTTFVGMTDPGGVAFARLETLYQSFSAAADRQIGTMACTSEGMVWDFGEAGIIVADPTLSFYAQQSVRSVTGSAPAIEDGIGVSVTIYYESVTLTAQEFLAALSLHENLS